MKVEWLVIVHHHGTVNTFSIRVQTARQAPKADSSGIYRDFFSLQEFISYVYKKHSFYSN
jgi:hypothetical protein